MSLTKFLLLASLLWPRVAQAQVSFLPIGASLTGEISRSQERYFHVDVTAGEHLIVLLEKATGFSSRLDIKHGALPTATGNDDSDGDVNDDSDQAVEVRRTQAGTYFVRVRAECCSGTGGSFTITAHTPATMPVLPLGTPVAGTLSRQLAEAYYRISPGAGQHLIVVLEKTSRFSSRLDIMYDGLPTTSDNDNTDGGVNDNSDQAVDVQDTGDGNYFVRVRPECCGGTGGGFTVTAHTLATMPALPLGRPVTATLSRQLAEGYYQISPGAGEHLIVVLEKATGFSSRLDIKGGALPTTADNDDSDGDVNDDSDQAVEIQVTQAERYFVRVRSECCGGTGGSFTITAHTSATMPTLPPGTPVAGTLSRQLAEAYYRISPGAGQHLIVVLEKTSGFSSRLDIRYDGLPTTSDNDNTDGGVNDNSDQAVDVQHTGDGNYFVRVRPECCGGTGGSFTITAHTLATMPALPLGAPVAATLPRQLAERYYQISPGAGEHLIAVLEKATGFSSRLDIRGGALPTTADNDDSDGDVNDGSDQAVEIQATEARRYFVRVRAECCGGTGGTFTITAHTLATMPVLPLGTPVAGTLSRQLAEAYYRISSGAGQHLIVVLEKTSGFSSRLDIKHEGLPTTADSDDSDGGVNDNSDQAVEVQATESGSYFVRVRPECCRGVGGNFRITAQVLSRISPSRGGNAGSITITIGGESFDPHAQVSLRKAGADDIIAIEVSVSAFGTHLSATFDLRAAQPGSYDVVVSNPGGPVLTLPAGFEVIEGGEPKLWLEIVGTERLRAGRRSRYAIRLGNAGSADAYDQTLTILLPGGADYELTLPHQVPEWVPLGGTPDDEVAIPLWVLRLSAGSTWEIPISVTPSPSRFRAGDHFEIRAELVRAQSSYSRSGNISEIDSSPMFQVTVDTVLELLNREGQAGSAAADSLITRQAVEQRARETLQETGREYGWLIIRPPYEGMVIGGIIGAIAAPFLGVDPWTGAGVGTTIGGLIQTGIDLFHVKLRELKGAADLIAGSADLVVGPYDPNDKAGPFGYDSDGTPPDERQRFIPADSPVNYVVFYENLETATAPAQEVLITDQLDSALDWSTFSFGSIQIGDTLVAVPEGQPSFTTTADLRPAVLALVDVDCQFDAGSGLIECLLRGRDPNTGELADFLPPNTDAVAPRGEGWVSYTVIPKSDLRTGTIIRNSATIDFEVGIPPDAMDTPEVFNTIDADPPASEVVPLAPHQESSSFEVEWVGHDIGSGVKDYTIFVSEDGGPYTRWLVHTAASSATFTGQPAKTYSFYSVARDGVGNVESNPTDHDALTTIAPTVRPCIGDCNGDLSVSVSELVTGVNLALGKRGAASCTVFDADGDGRIEIHELVAGVDNALRECRVPQSSRR